MATKWQEHRDRWLQCQDCDLCKTRKHVVLLRGSIPAKVLFVGEGPGESEDVIGTPFVGPAGRLLDQIMQEAGLQKGQFALTNLVACIPRDGNKKATTPPDWAIAACSSRLTECIDLVHPQVIVWVGKEARVYGPNALSNCKMDVHLPVLFIDLIHPAAILRMHVSQQGLAIKRCVIALAEAVSRLD